MISREQIEKSFREQFPDATEDEVYVEVEATYRLAKIFMTAPIVPEALPHRGLKGVKVTYAGKINSDNISELLSGEVKYEDLP